MPTARDPLRLERLTLREIRLPLVEPFRTAHGVVDVRRVLLARLVDADGTVAWSECVAEDAPGYSPDTVDGCWLALRQWIAPLVLGVPFASPAAVHARLEAAVRGHAMARATLEMGLWAVQAAREGVPLAALLAAAGEVVPSGEVRSGIALGFQSDPAALGERVRRAAHEGYGRVKVKIEPGRDLEWVAAARDAVRPATLLAVDANGSYSLDDADHVAALLALDGMGLSMIEQPLAHDDFVRHAELQAMLRTPVCLDESIRDAASVSTMLALRAGRMVNLKPARVGGLTAALLVHRACAATGTALWCGGMLEAGIGRAYNVALASLPGFTEPGDLSPSARYWARDIVTPPWTMDADGRVRVPLDRPGTGVTVDEELIDELTVRSEILHAP